MREDQGRRRGACGGNEEARFTDCRDRLGATDIQYFLDHDYDHGSDDAVCARAVVHVTIFWIWDHSCIERGHLSMRRGGWTLYEMRSIEVVRPNPNTLPVGARINRSLCPRNGRRYKE